jgi:hypothetical protein
MSQGPGQLLNGEECQADVCELIWDKAVTDRKVTGHHTLRKPYVSHHQLYGLYSTILIACFNLRTFISKELREPM